MNLTNLVDELGLTGGFSYNITTGESTPSNGYMVSLHGYEMVIPSDIFHAKDIRDYVSNNAAQLYREDLFMGGWIKDDKVYLDVSVNILDLETAVYTGMVNNQQSIYDVVNKISLMLPSPQRSGTMSQNRTYNARKAKDFANNYIL
jgi:hypothetical protein